MNYSGALPRIAACVIDALVIVAAYMVIGFILGIFGLAEELEAASSIGFWFYGGLICLPWVYFAGLESSHLQATLGKKMFGLKVTTLEGERISFLRATVRYFSKYVSQAFFMIGFLMVPLSQRKQGLHDKIAQTFVLKQEQSDRLRA